LTIAIYQCIDPVSRPRCKSVKFPLRFIIIHSRQSEANLRLDFDMSEATFNAV